MAQEECPDIGSGSGSAAAGEVLTPPAETAITAPTFDWTCDIASAAPACSPSNSSDDPGSTCRWHLGVTTTIVSAGTYLAPGAGIAEYYTTGPDGNYVATGVTTVVYNVCDAIPSKQWVNINCEPYSERNYASLLCARDTSTPQWYCISGGSWYCLRYLGSGGEDTLTTGTTSWTVPDGVNVVIVRIRGAGGGGGQYASGVDTTHGSGGGGGGSYVERLVYVTPGTVIPVQVGAGGAIGAPGEPGNAGQVSWFWSPAIVLATGGKGGDSVINGVGGPGGDSADCVGDFALSGGRGGDAGPAGTNRTAGAGGGCAGSDTAGSDGGDGDATVSGTGGAGGTGLYAGGPGSGPTNADWAGTPGGGGRGFGDSVGNIATAGKPAIMTIEWGADITDCYFLSDTQATTMLTEGYTLLSGPHDTEEECLASCGASSDSGSAEPPGGETCESAPGSLTLGTTHILDAPNLGDGGNLVWWWSFADAPPAGDYHITVYCDNWDQVSVTVLYGPCEGEPCQFIEDSGCFNFTTLDTGILLLIERTGVFPGPAASDFVFNVTVDTGDCP